MILHWLKTGWRSLIANPLFSLITIASLSVGCCGALLAGATIRQHLEFDRWFPEAERTLLVRPHFVTATNPDPAASNIWFWGQKRAVETVPGVEMQTRVGFDRMGMPSPENAQPEEGAEAPIIRGLRIESNFFDVFGLTFIEGSAVGRGVVLSESMARRLYGPPPWLGKRFQSGNATNTTVTFSSQVTGVVRDMPATSHLKVDVFSYHYAQVIAGNENNWRGDWVGGHYIRV
jgi:putative ABC transport system permease protein